MLGKISRVKAVVLPSQLTLASRPRGCELAEESYCVEALWTPLGREKLTPFG
jgi:hypothetical protein